MWLLSINSVDSTWSGLRQFVNRAREGGERGESSGGHTQHQSESLKEQETEKDRKTESDRERDVAGDGLRRHFLSSVSERAQKKHVKTT